MQAKTSLWSSVSKMYETGSLKVLRKEQKCMRTGVKCKDQCMILTIFVWKMLLHIRASAFEVCKAFGK